MLLPTSSSADCARPPEPMLVQPLVAILGLSDHVKFGGCPDQEEKGTALDMQTRVAPLLRIGRRRTVAAEDDDYSVGSDYLQGEEA